MSYSPKSTPNHADRVAESLVGGYVASASLPGKGDLSDWVELMEAVEALCPVWPKREAPRDSSKNVL